MHTGNSISGTSLTQLWQAIVWSDGITEVRRIIIENNEQVNELSSNGLPPLWAAVQMQKLDIVEALVEGGADVSFTSKDGRSILKLAETKGNSAIIAIIKGKLANKVLPPQSSSATSNTNASSPSLPAINPKTKSQFSLHLSAREMLTQIETLSDVMAAFACCLSVNSNGDVTGVDHAKRLQLLSAPKVQKLIPQAHGGSAVIISAIKPTHPGPKLPDELSFLNDITITIVHRYNLKKEKIGISLIGGLGAESSFQSMQYHVTKKLGLFTDNFNIGRLLSNGNIPSPLFRNFMYDTSLLVNTMFPKQSALERYRDDKIDVKTYAYYKEKLSEDQAEDKYKAIWQDEHTVKFPQINSYMIDARDNEHQLQQLKPGISTEDLNGTLYEVEHVNILECLHRFGEFPYKHEPLAVVEVLWNIISNLKNMTEDQKWNAFKKSLTFVTQLIIQDIKNTIQNPTLSSANHHTGIYQNKLHHLEPSQAIAHWKRLVQINFTDIANNYSTLLANISDWFDLTVYDLRTLDDAMEEIWQKEKHELEKLYQSSLSRAKMSGQASSSHSNTSVTLTNDQHQKNIQNDLKHLRTSPLSAQLYDEESAAILSSDGFLYDETSYLKWDETHQTSPNTRAALTGYRYYPELTQYCKGAADNMENLLALCLDPITGKIMDNPVQVVVAYQDQLYVLVCDLSTLQGLPFQIFNDGEGPRKKNFTELQIVKEHFADQLQNEYQKKPCKPTSWVDYLKSLHPLGKVKSWNHHPSPTNVGVLIERLIKHKNHFLQNGFNYQSYSGGLRKGLNEPIFTTREAKALVAYFNSQQLKCSLKSETRCDNDIMTWYQYEYIQFDDFSYDQQDESRSAFINKLSAFIPHAQNVLYAEKTDNVPEVVCSPSPPKVINATLFQAWAGMRTASDPIKLAMGKLITLINTKEVSSIDIDGKASCAICYATNSDGGSTYHLLAGEVKTLMSYFNSYELNCRTTEKFGGDRHCGYTDYYLSFPNLNHNKKEMIQAIEALMKKDIAAVSSRSSTKILRTAAYPPASSSSSRQSQATPWAGQNTVFSFSD